MHRLHHRRALVAASLAASLLLGLTGCEQAMVAAQPKVSWAQAISSRRPPRTTTTPSTPATTTTTTAPASGPGRTTLPPAPTTSTPPTTAAPPPTTTAPPPSTTTTSPPASAPATSGGWEITVYVTPVERYYSGSLTAVSGCPTIECGRRTPKVALGSYPADFVTRVADEGTGLITSGTYAGRYLNWSYDTGYWLDTAPRDSWGNPLVPFVSAAADGLARGTRIRIASCGTDESGDAPDPAVAAALQGATWEIRDEFTPGLGGTNHIDLYLGLEDRPDYEATSPFWITYVGATLLIT